MKRKKLFAGQNEITKLVSRHIEPPFSYLNSTSSRWQVRKRWWKSKYNLGGIEHENADLQYLGGCFPRIWNLANCIENIKNDPKGKTLATHDKPSHKLMREKTATKDGRLKFLLQTYSVFDPVLAELMYLWFCPKGGRVLDPFAGEPTKGIVAAASGFDYVGMELRQQQVAANVAKATKYGLKPQWVCGDSKRIYKILRKEPAFDLLFTSPPYYDLEKYSTANKDDASTFGTYEQFMAWYAEVFAASIRLLKDERFVVIKVGEIRAPDGTYRNFVGDNVELFKRLGLRYYNEIVLMHPVGTGMLRTKHFRTCRKLVKLHQNILVFFKTQQENVSKAVKAVFEDKVE